MQLYGDLKEIERTLYEAELSLLTAHTESLRACGLLSEEEAEALRSELTALAAEGPSGVSPHEALEKRLKRTGEKIRLGLSDREFAAAILRLVTRGCADGALEKLKELLDVLLCRSREGKAIMPGFDCGMRAQPVSLSQYLNGYGEKFMRDLERIEECRKRINVSPLGSGALAGTSLPIDRDAERRLLGFSALSENAIDANEDRDFFSELLFCFTLAQYHLGALCGDIVRFSTEEYGFWKLGEDACNAERMQSGAGRLFGALVSSLSDIPFSHGRVRENLYLLLAAWRELGDALDGCTGLLRGLSFRFEEMFGAADSYSSTAEDAKEYLERKGLTPREAEEAVSRLLSRAAEKRRPLSRLAYEEFSAVSPLFEKDILGAVNVRVAVESRNSAGGSSQEATRRGVSSLRRRLKNH